jgi:hypothetical protein
VILGEARNKMDNYDNQMNSAIQRLGLEGREELMEDLHWIIDTFRKDITDNMSIVVLESRSDRLEPEEILVATIVSGAQMYRRWLMDKGTDIRLLEERYK